MSQWRGTCQSRGTSILLTVAAGIFGYLSQVAKLVVGSSSEGRMRFSEVVALCIALLLTTFVVIFFVLPKLPSEDPEPLASTIDPQETLLAQMNAGNLLAHVAGMSHLRYRN